jgi:hypothetical protein
MHEELENFERNQVCTLVEPPRDVNVIGTKWVFKSKQGEDGEVVRNKAHLIAHKLVPTSNYHKEEETIKSIKTHYPFSPKPSFKPKRDVKKETPKSREEAFVCIFYGRVGHLDEFCFHRNS